MNRAKTSSKTPKTLKFANEPVLPPSAGDAVQRQVEDERRLREGGLEAVGPAVGGKICRASSQSNFAGDS